MPRRGSLRMASAVLLIAAAVAAPGLAGAATSRPTSTAYWAIPHAVTTRGEVTVDGHAVHAVSAEPAYLVALP